MTTRPLMAVMALALLAGCGPFPDARLRADPPPRATDAAPAGLRPADVAESACLEAGRAAGFDVRRVLGTREVMGAQGLDDSRDVMLAIRRDGRDYEVRCAYSYLTSSARIMTL